VPSFQDDAIAEAESPKEAGSDHELESPENPDDSAVNDSP
jgi:hypothetical protein